LESKLKKGISMLWRLKTAVKGAPSIWSLSVLCLFFLGGCNFNWTLPGDAYVTCSSNAECPAAYECKAGYDGAKVCVDIDGKSVCGDGLIAGERIILNKQVFHLTLGRL
jgi:hypothetical protein